MPTVLVALGLLVAYNGWSHPRDRTLQPRQRFYGCLWTLARSSMQVEFLVVLSFASRCFSSDTPVVHFSQEPNINFQTPARPGINVGEGLRGCVPSEMWFIYLFIYLIRDIKFLIFFLREKVQPHRPRGLTCSFTDFERYYEVHTSQLAECFLSSSSRSEDWGMNLETQVSLNNETDASARQIHHAFE